jgi:hypothetical protein
MQLLRSQSCDLASLGANFQSGNAQRRASHADKANVIAGAGWIRKADAALNRPTQNGGYQRRF